MSITKVTDNLRDVTAVDAAKLTGNVNVARLPSTVLNSNISDVTLTDTTVDGSTIDPSNVTNSTITAVTASGGGVTTSKSAATSMALQMSANLLSGR